ncbi:hypothetical protein PHMEG_00030174 [Phytophthora megakarya]|uniref:Uncharacterized protein n=1 Tax=Phytophthora megakarya TaxID=4795 RepID=A0A225V2G0_9STRA|nr:hypothetical protein PHMEG_00030174 [Phytophthora megakarya]
MTSDIVFLTEVEGFLASCDLPALLLNQTRNENISRTSKHSTRNFEQESSSEDRTAARDSKCPDENQQKSDAGKTTKYRSYCTRRKNERINLRRQVSQLTAELDKLRKTKEVNKSQRPSKWMITANFQEEERVKAEDRQRQLYVAIETRAAMIQSFVQVTRDRLGDLGGLTEHEVNLIDNHIEATGSSRPFKRIRVDPPLDVISENYLNELNDPMDQTNSGGDSGKGTWGDSGQVFQQCDKDDAHESFIFVDTANLPNTTDLTSIAIAPILHLLVSIEINQFTKDLYKCSIGVLGQ